MKFGKYKMTPKMFTVVRFGKTVYSMEFHRLTELLGNCEMNLNSQD